MPAPKNAAPPASSLSDAESASLRRGCDDEWAGAHRGCLLDASQIRDQYVQEWRRIGLGQGRSCADWNKGKQEEEDELEGSERAERIPHPLDSWTGKGRVRMEPWSSRDARLRQGVNEHRAVRPARSARQKVAFFNASALAVRAVPLG